MSLSRYLIGVEYETLRLYALVQSPPLAFADGGHAVLNVEMRFSADEFLDGLDADRAVEVSMELLWK